MMNINLKIIALLVSTALLIACAGQKPQEPVKVSAKPKSRQNQAMNHSPPKLPGQWTVEDVLDDFGASAKRKMSPYFVQAKVAFPPSEVILLAFKEEKTLELWARAEGEYRLIRDYGIQAASGRAGPKLRQGDKQVPEGIYRISSLNPNSHYHLSMKLNYPNEFDLYHAGQEGRFDPGSDIFIHGKAASIGCLAMGDEAIEELFVLAALVGKENVKVVIAPRDPRQTPLTAYGAGLPGWTPELYDIIAREIQALSSEIKLSNGGPSAHPGNQR
jgi:hypothetical protein